MNEFQKIALLIDADNAQAAKIEAILKEVSVYGRIVIKRAYGNWSKPSLQSWETEIKRFAISAIQQFDFASGKNASDMALTIDAMELLYAGKYDCFVIVSSDSDFTTLAIKLHEAGVYVIGYGKKDTVESFRSACDEFNYVEDLAGTSARAASSSRTAKKSSSKSSAKSAEGQGKAADSGDKAGKKAAADEPGQAYESGQADESGEGGSDAADSEAAESHALTLKELEELLKIAEEKYADVTGYVNVATAGTYIKRVRSDYSIKAFGYSKLSEYVRDNPKKYDVEERDGKGTKLLMYKCRKPASGRRKRKSSSASSASSAKG